MTEEPGGIHLVDPFADPEGARDPARRLRGRLPAPVTVWTSGAGRGRAGVTVSSLAVVDGDPAYVLGIVADTADLLDVARSTGAFVVHVLGAGDGPLADRFAGVAPSPGGRFTDLAVEESRWGPVLTRLGTRAGCSLAETVDIGPAVLVRGRIEQVWLDDGREPLVYLRGRYRRLEAPR